MLEYRGACINKLEKMERSGLSLALAVSLVALSIGVIIIGDVEENCVMVVEVGLVDIDSEVYSFKGMVSYFCS